MSTPTPTIKERDRTTDAPVTGSQTEWCNKRATEQARRGATARAANGRKKGNNPLTSEMDYSVDKTEFMNAMAEYVRVTGRKFPTWSNILEVLRSLGYVKGEAPAPGPKTSGVNQTANGRFAATLRRDGQSVHVGTFDTIEEAVEAQRLAG